MIDREPNSPYGVICADCGKQGLTKEEYLRQMNKPDSLWACPVCKDVATWDDDRYEDVFYMPDEQ